MFTLLPLINYVAIGRTLGYAYFDNSEECTDGKWWDCVFSASAKIDMECNNIFDSISIKREVWKHHKYGAMRIFDQNGMYKDEMVFYVSGSSHLGMIQLPFDPVNDSGYVCSQRILSLFYDGRGRGMRNLSIKQEGFGQIMYIIKNSIKKAPSEWMSDFDTTFQAYCSVISPSDFSELGIDLSKWVKSYFCDDYCDSLLIKSAKGLLLCYYAGSHAHMYGEMNSYPIPNRERIKPIPISSDIMLYQTAHGVLLRKGHLYRWVYFENHAERLRWPSIHKVTISDGQINIFLERDYNYEKPGKSERLVFLLEDLLK
ncbi:MAG: hypothetical protein LBU83_06945 [Bacteroidales bacterium]|jgi:hypothetical protein|nr:hypothetical protein [Bacteroidales bacterium]